MAARKKAAAKKPPAKRKSAATGTKKAAARKTAARKTAKKKSAAPRSARKKPAGDPLQKLRALIAVFPETSERISHGAPTWWGGKKTFATFHVDHHGDGRIALWCKMPDGAQEALVDSDPVRFYRPPYVGPSGWVGVNLDGGIDWEMVGVLLEEGYRMVAPKRALAALDAAREG